MNLSKKLRLAFPFVAVALLAGCGNDADIDRTRAALKEVRENAFSRLTGKKAEPAKAPDPLKTIQTTLDAVPDVPLLFVFNEKQGNFSVASVYAQNGPIVTWVNVLKQTFAFDKGMIVATRGLGNDLMSVEDGGAARLISARSEGTVSKTYRFLNGLDQTTRLQTQCTVSLGDMQQVASGEISTDARVVYERCTSTAYTFANTYWVDANGRVVQSLQWTGPANDKYLFQRLRF